MRRAVIVSCHVVWRILNAHIFGAPPLMKCATDLQVGLVNLSGSNRQLLALPTASSPRQYQFAGELSNEVSIAFLHYHRFKTPRNWRPTAKNNPHYPGSSSPGSYESSD